MVTVEAGWKQLQWWMLLINMVVLVEVAVEMAMVVVVVVDDGDGVEMMGVSFITSTDDKHNIYFN